LSSAKIVFSLRPIDRGEMLVDETGKGQPPSAHVELNPT